MLLRAPSKLRVQGTSSPRGKSLENPLGPVVSLVILPPLFKKRRHGKILFWTSGQQLHHLILQQWHTSYVCFLLQLSIADFPP